MMSCDLLGYYRKFILSQNVAFIDAFTTWELFCNIRSKGRFQRHKYSEYQKLVSPIKRYSMCRVEWVPAISLFLFFVSDSLNLDSLKILE